MMRPTVSMYNVKYYYIQFIHSAFCVRVTFNVIIYKRLHIAELLDKCLNSFVNHDESFWLHFHELYIFHVQAASVQTIVLFKTCLKKLFMLLKLETFRAQVSQLW